MKRNHAAYRLWIGRPTSAKIAAQQPRQQREDAKACGNMRDHWSELKDQIAEESVLTKANAKMGEQLLILAHFVTLRGIPYWARRLQSVFPASASHRRRGVASLLILSSSHILQHLSFRPPSRLAACFDLSLPIRCTSACQDAVKPSPCLQPSY